MGDARGRSLIHGLLQTRDYALAVHHAAALRLAPEEIDRMVDARMRRQEILDRQPEFRLWVVLDEAVLHRAVGGPQVMAAQIEHLMDLAQRPTIDIQVLPLGAGATAAGTGHFVILGRGTPMTTGIVYIELQQDGLYLDRQLTRFPAAHGRHPTGAPAMTALPHPAAPDLADAFWRKSSHSAANNDCVEVARASDRIAIRDSKEPGRAVVTVPTASFAALLNGLGS
ncbi:DUF397 domain-containing protein [Streptomyces xiamenensis]|uniref:DUF397 domain-containing protein n=1 Tax=Streptomyces xiamenensis TaxID=408015 RepID=UPI0035E0CCB6